jgi:hypothetical protein
MRMSSEVAYHPSVPRHLQIQRVCAGRVGEGTEGTPSLRWNCRGVPRSATRSRGARRLAATTYRLPSRPRSFACRGRDGALRKTNLIFGYRAQVKVTSETVPACPS